MHGGSGKAARAKSERIKAEAKLARILNLGDTREVNPQEALLSQVWEASANVEFLRYRVQNLDAIYGPNHVGDAEAHVLVKMYNSERDRLTKYAKVCVDAGLAEKQIQTMQVLGVAVVGVIQALLEYDALKLTPAQVEAGRKFASERLRLLVAA